MAKSKASSIKAPSVKALRAQAQAEIAAACRAERARVKAKWFGIMYGRPFNIKDLQPLTGRYSALRPNAPCMCAVAASQPNMQRIAPSSELGKVLAKAPT